MKTAILLICAFSFLIAAAARADVADDMPADVPHVTEVIHHLKDPFAKTWRLSLRGDQLYGDKFLNTRGLTLELRRWWTEHWAVLASGTIYSSSASGDAYALAQLNAAPTMYNPSALAQLGLLWAPIYGKLALGSYIQRVRLGFQLGLHGAQETNVAITETSLNESRLALGGTLGLDAEFPISARLAIATHLDWLAHEKLNGSDTDPFRQLWQFSLGLEARL